MSVLEITTYGRNTLRRLRLEARLVAATPTPGLARACERDPFSPSPALMTELVPDVTLDDLVSIAPLPAAAALHALQDVARTLEAMHECGLVHGDLRPATVYVLPDGRAALAQPADLPPAAGSRTEAGRRADAHAFALLAFELLTGDHPRDVATAVAQVTRVPVLPRPAALSLKRALTATPARRPAPTELVAALDALPPEDWPSNHLHRPEPPPPAPVPVAAEPEPEPVLKAAPEPEPEPGPAPARVPRVATSPVVVRIVPPKARKSRVRRIFEIFVVLLGLATVLAGGSVGAWLLFAAPTANAGDPAAGPHVARVALSVTPPQVQCPRATLHLAATIVTDGGAGELELHWRLPDGSTAETERIPVRAGRRTVHTALELRLAGYRQVRGDVVAVLRPGDVRATVPLRYLCPTAGKKGSSSSV